MRRCPYNAHRFSVAIAQQFLVRSMAKCSSPLAHVPPFIEGTRVSSLSTASACVPYGAGEVLSLISGEDVYCIMSDVWRASHPGGVVVWVITALKTVLSETPPY